ncbi:MAG: hypothetical protein CMG78_09545 [Marinobacter sp.]|nr:hypothetical protein [Marinobacter sp.]|tara:strand:- start:3562 stop:4272 length:711 start_codon:yes stop_codon:yes gene_type:complete
MLKTVIDTTTGLNEALIPFYAERDGKYYLQIEGVREHPDVLNLVNAYESVKADREKVRAERDQYKARSESLPDDFDPEKWSKLKDGKADEAAVIKVRQQLEAERDDWKGKYESAIETARKNAIERDLVQQLTAAGVTDEGLMAGAIAVLSRHVAIGEDGVPHFETDMGPKAIDAYVREWAAGKGKGYVDPGRGGGAKGGNGGGAPVTKETFATMGDKERIELFRTDPETFKRLAAA